jgi:RHS repeat-associated protein
MKTAISTARVRLIAILFAGTLSAPLMCADGIAASGPEILSERQPNGVALEEFLTDKRREDLEQLVHDFPGAPLTPVLQNTLASRYRMAGRHTLALQHWDAVWNQLKDETNAVSRQTADHALVSQLELLSSLGRVDRMHDLLKAAEKRKVTDHNDFLTLETAREAYLVMVDHPTLSYRCGSLALASIARQQGRPSSVSDALIEEPSTANGISLRRLIELNRQMNLGLVAVKRTDNTLVPVPAVVHWSQNHYGALLDYRADIHSYLLIDPTFGGSTRISEQDLNAEASGYFLVEQKQKPNGWKNVSDSEAAGVFGRGYPYNIKDSRDKGCHWYPTLHKQKCAACQGMPIWWVSEPYINLWLADEPWAYNTSRGEEMAFHVTLKQRDPVTNSFAYLRPGFLHNWYSKIYIRGLASSQPVTSGFADWTATLYLGTGGEQTYSKSSMSDPDTKSSLQFSYGDLTDGTVYAVPGFPLGTTDAPPVNSWYDPVSGFRVFYPDGSIDRYGLIYWRNNTSAGYYECEALLTTRTDPAGNVTTLTYETYSYSGATNYRLKTVTDYDGNVITFVYSPDNPSVLLQAISPYGQTATFGYDFQGNLHSIQDAVSMQSTVDWDDFGRPIDLNTPYGMTSFNYYEVPVPDPQGSEGNLGGHDRVNRAITVTDANGGTNLYVYRFDSSSFMAPQYLTGDYPTGTPLNTLDLGSSSADTTYAAVSFRNSFHWNPRQCTSLSTLNVTNLTANDYIKARLKHWLGDSNNVAVVDVLSVEREPSADGITEGQKTFYDYDGKTLRYLQGTNTEAAVTAHRQPSGNTDFDWKQYNSADFVTRDISTYTLSDGVVRARTNIFTYATNTIQIRMQATCPFCPVGTTSLGGCPQSPAGPATNIVLSGAYTLNTVNTSKMVWPSLLLSSTNWDQSAQRMGGYSVRSGTTSKGCGGWNEDVTYSYTPRLPTKATNELGYITTFTYNSDNQTTSLRLPSGLTISNVFDANGFLTSIIDVELQRTNTFSYTNGLVYVYQNELGLRVTNVWDGLRRLVSAADAEGYVSNVYSRLDLAANRDKLGNWTYFGYDPLGNLIATTNANQEVSLASYCSCGSLLWTRDPLNHYTYFYSDLAGRLTNVVTEDGFSATSTYDPLGQLIQFSTGTGSMTNSYNLQGLLIKTVGAAGVVLSNAFDIMDRAIANTDASGVTESQSYDLIGRVLTNIVAGALTNTFVYSTNGLVQAADGLRTNLTSYKNDVVGRTLFRTNANNEVTQFLYDPAGNLTNMLDGKLQKTAFQYDLFSRLTNKIDHTGASVLQLTYNANGQINTAWTPAKGTATHIYDVVGRVRTNSYPSDPPVVFNYDAAGQLTNVIDALGTTAFTYSPVGQLSTEGGLWANDTVTHTYNNRLRASLILNGQTTTYSYDQAFRLTNITSSAGVFGYQYHPGLNGNYSSPLVRTLSLPGSLSITNDYDFAGRLIATKMLNASQTVLDSYAYGYDAAGRRLTQTRTDNSTVAYTYDRIGQLKTAKAQEPNATPRLNEQFGYAYDAAGNLAYRTNNGLTLSFGVDPLNQLTAVTRSGTLTAAGVTAQSAVSGTVNNQTVALYGDKTFATTAGLNLLNGINNFTSIVQYAGGVLVTNLSALPLPTPVSFLYDANGNLTNDGNRSFTYDDENRLVRVLATNGWRTDFVYDGLGRQRVLREFTWLTNLSIWVQTNEVRYLYDRDLVIQERDAANVPMVTYTRGMSGMSVGGSTSGLLARTDSSGSAYYHTDGGGNITTLVYSNQVVAAKYLYDPFGNLVSKFGALADANRYRFSSKEYHEKSGLYAYGYRFYDPNLQRWINRDPLQEYGGINLYRFSANSPLMFGDADGRALLSWICGEGWSGDAADEFEASIGESMMEQWDEMADGYHVLRCDGILASREMLVDGMADRYADMMLNYGEGNMYLIAANDLTGGTSLMESLYGVDLQSQTELSGDERLQRGLMGGGQMLLTVAGGLSAIDSARAGYTGIGMGFGSGSAAGEDIASAESGTGRAAAEDLAEAESGSGEAAAADDITPTQGGCFTAGTLVSTPCGQKSIENIRVGDMVYAYDFESGNNVECRVAETPTNFTFYWVEIQIGDQTITATRSHLFWEQSTGTWVEAVNLHEGMEVLLQRGEVATISHVQLHELKEPQATYNLIVENEHNYYVSDDEVLVHNGYPVRPKYPPPTEVGENFQFNFDTSKDYANSRSAGVRRAKAAGYQNPGDNVGHHVNTVEDHPQLAAEPDNIKFVKDQAANLQEHGGNFQNRTSGPLRTKPGC